MVPSRIALLPVALFLSTPLVQLVTGSLMVENVWAALLLGGVVAWARFRETGRRGFLYTAALLTGTAVACKFGAAVFAIPFGLLVAVELRQMRRQASMYTALTAAGLLVLTAAPPYLTAFAKTGNPVFPFLNAVFKSPLFDSSVSFADQRFSAPLRLSSLYDLTFRTGSYLEGQDGAFGFHYFLFLPMCLVLFRRTWPYLGRIALLLALVFGVLSFSGQSNARYLYPALPLLTIAIAAAFAELRAGRSSLYRAAVVCSFGLLALNFYFLPASGWYHKGFYLPRKADVAEYLEKSAPTRALIEYLNKKGAEGKVAFFETSQTAGLHQSALVNSWYNPVYSERIHSLNTGGDYLALAKELGVRYVIAPSSGSGVPIKVVAVEQFLQRYTVPEFQSGPYCVARLRDDSPDPSESDVLRDAKPLEAGNYDDIDASLIYTGGWLRGVFPEAESETITYANRPGSDLLFSFNGTAFTYTYTKAFNRGIARIEVDGAQIREVDLYSAQTEWQASTSFTGLPAGNHTVRISVALARNPSSSNTFVDIDALRVHP
jgi:hypothetical protein